MYDRAITDRALDAATAANQASPVLDNRWALERHSTAEIQQAITHFADLLDPETGAPIRELRREEQRFIQNERRVCALDFEYYAREYATIIAWDKTSTRFVPNVAQQMVLHVWADLERRALAISMQQLKARQLGVTTLTEIAVAHRCQFQPRCNAVVASADPQKSAKMAKMVGYNWKQMPWWLMPMTTKVKDGLPAEFGEISSSLLVQAGNQFTGVARGDTPNVAHISEVCEWPNPEELIDSALLRAMHETPDMFLVLESTALGRGNWWHDTWRLSKRWWSEGRSRLCPIFLPWFVGTHLYPTPAWLRARPIPRNWQPSDNTIAHAERARQYVLTNGLLFQYLARHDRSWQLPREQLWFYEVERDNAIEKGELNKFLQEMPADDQEAFQSSNVSAIDTQIILSYRERVPTPVGVYTIVGSGIPQSLVVSRRQWDFSKPTLTVRANTILRRCDDVWQFVPILFEGYSDTDPMLKLFIWERPEPNEQYGVGVDTADGLGLDRSVCQAFRCASPLRPDAQVAEFASDYIRANQLWPMSLALGCYYATHQDRQGRTVQPRVAVECKGNGEIVQFEMKKRGWTNFHPWMRYDNRKQKSPATAFKEGVFTNQWFRSQMMDMMLTKIDEDTVDIRSPWLIEEMEALERDETKQSMKAAFGEHDDRFMAAGFVVFSMHVLDIPNRQFSKRVPQYATGNGEPPVDDSSLTTYATFEPGLQARSDLPGRALIPLERRRPVWGMPARYALGRVSNEHIGKLIGPIGRTARRR